MEQAKQQPKAKKLMPPQASPAETTPELSQAQKTCPTDDSWRDNAECLDAPDKMIFSQHELPTKHRKAARELAKQYCGQCTVQEECLTEALAIKPPGIWGGLTEDERSKLKNNWKEN